jgi:hypothetical protein
LPELSGKDKRKSRSAIQSSELRIMDRKMGTGYPIKAKGKAAALPFASYLPFTA